MSEKLWCHALLYEVTNQQEFMTYLLPYFQLNGRSDSILDRFLIKQLVLQNVYENLHRVRPLQSQLAHSYWPAFSSES